MTRYIRVKVIPRSALSEIVEEMADGTIKIRVKAPAEKGKANKELISFLSKTFKVPRSSISIVNGLTDPYKLIKIQ